MLYLSAVPINQRRVKCNIIYLGTKDFRPFLQNTLQKAIALKITEAVTHTKA